MPQDTLLSKRIRPGLLIWFSMVFTVIMLADGNIGTFTVKVVYIATLEVILVTMYGAYFIGKSGENAVRIAKDPNNQVKPEAPKTNTNGEGSQYG